MADAVRSEKERSRDEIVDERGMLALSGGKVKNKMHGINRRHQRRGETDRGNMQSFVGSVAAGGSNVRDHTGRTTGVESEGWG